MNLKKTHLQALFCMLFIPVLLTSCVDLTANRMFSERKYELNHSPSTKLEKGEVHTMRGGLGIFSIGMNQLQVKAAERFDVPSASSMWYNAGDVSRTIVTYHYHSKRPIILIGHSLGANEQIKVARNLNKVGIPVALLVTVDAVSTTHVPPNVKQVLNVYKPGFVPMFSGLRLVADNPKNTQIENVNVNTLKNIEVNHFTIDKHSVVQAMILDRIKKVLDDARRQES